MSNRFDNIQFDPCSVTALSSFRDVMEHLIEMVEDLETLTDGRSKVLAINKLEEAYMWIGKSIRDSQLSRCEG